MRRLPLFSPRFSSHQIPSFCFVHHCCPPLYNNSHFFSSDSSHSPSSSSSFLTQPNPSTKLKVDPISEGSADSNTLVQRHSSDAALKKTARISASLPRFGTKAKELEKKQRIEEMKKKMQLMREHEEFLNATSSKDATTASVFRSRQELQRAEDDAWARVSEKYSFAVKPGFLPNYRSFLYELQKFEINVKVLTASERVVFGIDFVKTATNISFINSGFVGNHDSNSDAANELQTVILESLATDASESNSFAQILTWTRNVLEALHFGKGVSDLRRIGTALIPFAVPAHHYHHHYLNNQIQRESKRDKKDSATLENDEDDIDDVSTFMHATNLGIRGFLENYKDDPQIDFNSKKNFLKFLKLECKIHPDTPNSILFPPNRADGTAAAVADGATLARWAVVTLERDDTEDQLRKMMKKSTSNSTSNTTTTSSYRSPLLDGMDGSSENNNDNINNNNNNNVILSVSLQTWTYLVLSSMVSMLNRNDIGVPNYELVSTLHSQKDLEPMWHVMRKLSGMHESPWPIDPRLLWYPGKSS